MTTRSGLQEILPLSPLQQGMLFHAHAHAHAHAAGTGPDPYAVQVVLDLAGPLDGGTLRAAAHALLARHPNLRAGFRYEGISQPVQVIPRQVTLDWRSADLSGPGEPKEREDEAGRLLSTHRAHGFDVTAPPLMRFLLIRLENDRHLLAITNHHILLDGWSRSLMLRELFELYASGGDDSALPPVTDYREYLVWLAAQDRVGSEAAWREALSDAEPLLLADSGTPHVAGDPGDFERVLIELPPDTTADLRAVARRYALTLSTVLQGAWGLVLGHHTGRSDVTFGMTISSRSPELAGFDSMVGLFINTVPARLRTGLDLPVSTWLADVQRSQATLLPHQHLGLMDIHRVAGHRALFDSLLVVENYPLDLDSLTGASGLSIRDTRYTDGSHYPLSLVAIPGTRLQLRLGHRPDAIGPRTADTLAVGLRRVLEAFAADPEQRTARIDPMDPAERERIVAGDHGPAAVPVDHSLADAFRSQVARGPQRTAVRSREGTLSYAELDERSDRLARVLLKNGAGPERTVLVLQERSLTLVVGMLAVVKSGAAYVPLDPRLPANRIRTILTETGASLILADSTTTLPEPRPDDVPVILADAAPDAEQPSHVQLRPENLAYVMYTSGSTGVPKGVAITHRDVLELALDRCWQGSGHERVLLHSPASFDASTYELWVPLLTGGEVVLAPPGPLDLAALERLISRDGVTAMFLTTALFQVVAEENPAAFAGLRTLLAGGELVTPSAVARVLEHCPDLQLIHVYGPTEATTFSLRHPVPGADDVPEPLPIGRPLDGTHALVLDSALRPAPVGVTAELYISGAGLARGYWKLPAATAERFVAEPGAVPGSRMYRTGDLVRRRQDGALEFVGRRDGQVKIRGFRVEVGEVEAVLARHPAVARAFVVSRDAAVGRRELVAYAVPRPEQVIDPVELRRHAGLHLPDYMIPRTIVPMERLPLTPNGKVDRAALPTADDDPPPSPGRPFGTAREKEIGGIFAELLGAETVPADESFFDLGGNSLLLIQLRYRLERLTGQSIPIAAFFEDSTVRALSARLDRPAADDGCAAEPEPGARTAERRRRGRAQQMSRAARSNRLSADVSEGE